MKLNLGLIIDYLKTPYERIVGYPDGAMNLIGICPFVAEQQYAKDILYLAQWPQLRDQLQMPENVICVGGGESAYSLLDKRQVNGLIYSGDCTPSDIMFEVQKIFFDYAEKERTLLNTLLMNKPIQTILNACAAFLNCHASLYGSDFTLLGYSDVNLPPDSDVFWQETLAANRCLLPMIPQKRDKVFPKKSKTYPRSVFMNATGGENTHISSAFNSKDSHVATLIFSNENGSLSVRHLWLADYIAEIIHKTIIDRYTTYLNLHDYLRTSIATALRHSTVTDSRVLKISMTRLGWRTNDDYQILLIKLPIANRNLSHSLHDYENVFAGAYPNYVAFWHDDYIFVLLHNDACSSLDKFIPILKKQLTLNNGTCCIGMKFCDLNQLKLQYDLVTIPHKIPTMATHRIKYYRDILEMHVINELSSCFPLRAVCHYATIRLQEYDIANGTNYLETLEKYLLYDRSLLAASSKLYIHRSTLAYRIKCIQNIIPIQLEDPYERLHILLSCVAIRLMSNDTFAAVDDSRSNPRTAQGSQPDIYPDMNPDI